MDRSIQSPSIIVGIDGSKSAIRAALWAVDEAVHRDIPLRLVHVIDAAAHGSADASRHDRGYAAASRAAHTAWRAVEATGKPVKIEMEILRGDPVAEMVEASRHAPLICLGSRGRHEHSGRHRGATATRVAETAMCSAAIIRHRCAPEAQADDGRIVAVLDESPASLAVLQTAIDEARLRNTPVLVMTPWPAGQDEGRHEHDDDDLRAMLDRHLEASERGDAVPRMSARPMPENVRKALLQRADTDRLVVVGKSAPGLAAELIGPMGRSKFRKTSCSVLVVR